MFWNREKKKESKFVKSRRRKIRRSKPRVNRRGEKDKSPNAFFGNLAKFHGTPDPALIAIIFVLIISGLLMVYSASIPFAQTSQVVNGELVEIGSPFSIVQAQMIWFTIGLAFAYIFFLIPTPWLRKASPILLAGGAAFLVYILPEALFGRTIVNSDGSITLTGIQMPFVEALNGAPRWINFGFTNLQPSEYVKFAFAIYMAAWLTRTRNTTNKNAVNLESHIKNVVLPFLVLLGAIAALILVQRDFDTTVLIGLVTLIIYYVSGTDFIHTIGTIVILIFAFFVGLGALLTVGYRRERVDVYVDIVLNGEPTDKLDDGFQVWSGLTALGSGGIFGRGFGDSIGKEGYLQETSYTDSIFVVIGEEFGLIGSVIVITTYLIFISIGLRIAQNADNSFDSLLAIGMTSLIGMQSLLNIAAVLAVIPFGGMPLPFFTYGGSTTITTMMAVGVLANVSKRAK